VSRRHDLVLGYYSVHTTPGALRNAELHIAEISGVLDTTGRP
jgi:hypothetical protein